MMESLVENMRSTVAEEAGYIGYFGRLSIKKRLFTGPYSFNNNVR